MYIEDLNKENYDIINKFMNEFCKINTKVVVKHKRIFLKIDKISFFFHEKEHLEYYENIDEISLDL